jgi:hypothetical protein
MSIFLLLDPSKVQAFEKKAKLLLMNYFNYWIYATIKINQIKNNHKIHGNVGLHSLQFYNHEDNIICHTSSLLEANIYLMLKYMLTIYHKF